MQILMKFSKLCLFLMFKEEDILKPCGVPFTSGCWWGGGVGEKYLFSTFSSYLLTLRLSTLTTIIILIQMKGKRVKKCRRVYFFANEIKLFQNL
jgi:hypothetical protein